MKMTIYENKTFALIKIHNDLDVFDFKIKGRLSDFSQNEILDFLAPVLVSYSKAELLLELKDNDLIKTMQQMGLKYSGYFVKDEESKLVNLWGQDINGKCIEIDEIVKESNVVRSRLRFNGVLKVSPFTNAKQFINDFSLKDRYPVGLIDLDYREVSSNIIVKPSVKTLIKKQNVDFGTVVQNRRSAKRIQSDCELEKIKDIFEMSLSFQSNYERPVGFAGGVGDYQLFLVRTNTQEKGLYKYDDKNNVLEKVEADVDSKIMKGLTFSQAPFENCENWILITTDHKKLLEKYGNRALRFSLLDAGGILHQMHLASTALSLNYRAIGGFDEVSLRNVLKLGSDRDILCMAGVSQ